ncbi:uncharacterized protein TRIADDRAFT_20956 [Trichoplax adhaerens]|uniref:Queuine tRNA-ribosyltransferase catalytic subunit 1 n=1 Tax=Trichoplax adhaerens TaxID=10228 RepID=B3RNX6_TRIAD|nr:hypothetical protein TRIADDRAFT_20956 [Trichoplax adhaerens]EDV27535.1 hypothetical protein TRIADDRAFT_20956 [Trichoplax adhaerens]|eukprot:XP_002109369.1 hypothetical protein TRIADDRAFT_20956 [Trichoplax adhaerens]
MTSPASGTACSSAISRALSFKLVAECSTSKARACLITLPKCSVESPVFMPVGTKGTMKGLTSKQLEDIGFQIILGNTYHLGTNPGPELMEKANGLHDFMNWKRSILTDSGGYQMVSLLDLAEITEEGVKFASPYSDDMLLLTPERSIEIQNSIGADIIMQLDDVVASTTEGPRVEEAMHRTIRWLDRCITAHKNMHCQNLFCIVQGGLDMDLRRKCVEEIVKRDTPGIAIGGLSGGEDKQVFWKVVDLCTSLLPKNKPRYLMGVGYAVDLVVCSALGVDMYDCVYPTRTARFGTALVPWGQLRLKQSQYSMDFDPIDKNCPCLTCKTYTRAYLNSIIKQETVACHLLSIHNLTYQKQLMESIRKNIIQNTFPQFVKDFMKEMFPDGNYPQWAVDALASVNIQL